MSEVLEIAKATIKGEFSGIVSRKNISYVCSHQIYTISFMVKLDQKIKGVPEEITVSSSKGRWEQPTRMIIQEGDELLIAGEIKKIKLRDWGVDVYLL